MCSNNLGLDFPGGSLKLENLFSYLGLDLVGEKIFSHEKICAGDVGFRKNDAPERLTKPSPKLPTAN